MTKKKMAVLTRDQILKVDDLVTEVVEVEEWGGSVIVRSLNGTERDEYEESLIVGQGKDREISLANARARLVYLSTIDEEGKRIFNNPTDVATLGTKNAAALDTVFSVCQRLSGMRKEDVEALVGNSKTDPSVGSTSD